MENGFYKTGNKPSPHNQRKGHEKPQNAHYYASNEYTEKEASFRPKPIPVKTVQEICHGNNLSEQTFYRGGKKYGNLELVDTKRFKELEKEFTSASEKA